MSEPLKSLSHYKHGDVMYDSEGGLVWVVLKEHGGDVFAPLVAMGGKPVEHTPHYKLDHDAKLNQKVLFNVGDIASKVLEKLK